MQHKSTTGQFHNDIEAQCPSIEISATAFVSGCDVQAFYGANTKSAKGAVN
jgi:hypothetical protein